MKSLSYCSRIVLILIGLFATVTAEWAAEPNEVVPADSFDQPPKMIKNVVPQYPFNMQQAGLIGMVDIEFIVDVEGRVINPIIVGSNNPWFERPAIEAILQWKFQPARKDGRAVNCRASQRIQFELYDRSVELWQSTKGKDHAKLPLEIRWDVCPVPLASTYPVYPAEALQAGRKGRAVVRYLVNTQGRIQTAKVLEASAPEFGGAAMASIDAWRFKPATRAGQPCSALLQMEFEFVPSGDSSVPVTSGLREVVHELNRKEPHVYPLETLDAVPKALSRRPPVYPSALREVGQPGEALIEFCIDEKGDAQLPRVVSATAPEFGYAAAQAVATWRFEPPMKNRKPVIARAQIPVKFKLLDGMNGETKPSTKETIP
jgi:TonB family protein